jgi:hypothetical protein
MTDRRRRQCGQAALEYVLVSVAIVAALRVRVPAFDDRSAMSLLVDAIRGAWLAFSYALAIPI